MPHLTNYKPSGAEGTRFICMRGLFSRSAMPIALSFMMEMRKLPYRICR